MDLGVRFVGCRSVPLHVYTQVNTNAGLGKSSVLGSTSLATIVHVVGLSQATSGLVVRTSRGVFLSSLPRFAKAAFNSRGNPSFHFHPLSVWARGKQGDPSPPP